jgi:hypothetical protein
MARAGSTEKLVPAALPAGNCFVPDDHRGDMPTASPQNTR